MTRIRLKNELRLMKKLHPRKFKGEMTEKLMEVDLILSDCDPIKIGHYKNNRFLIDVYKITKKLLKKGLTKQEIEKRERLLYYLKDKKKGLPDFIAFEKKNIFFVEVKSGKSELSKKQKKVRVELRNKGYAYICIKIRRGRYFYLDKGVWLPYEEGQKTLSKFNRRLF